MAGEVRLHEHADFAAFVAKSRAFFPKSYQPPEDLCFNDSDALFPPDHLRELIELDYERECARLFFRPHPPAFASRAESSSARRAGR